jgi:hypothetical protein
MFAIFISGTKKNDLFHASFDDTQIPEKQVASRSRVLLYKLISTQTVKILNIIYEIFMEPGSS